MTLPFRVKGGSTFMSFSIITRRTSIPRFVPGSTGMRGSNFTSLQHRVLQTAINRFVAEINAEPKPFVWTADPNKIIAAVKRGHQVLESIYRGQGSTRSGREDGYR